MKAILELCCWQLFSVGEVIRPHLVKVELSFSKIFEISTFRNHEKNGPLLPK